jgi:ABC-type branched-subunit amino acid transport system substrate-binding protein/Tfp pilus assembly protein PilF
MKNWLTLVFVLFIVSCTTPPEQAKKSLPPPSKSAQKLYQEAQTAFDQGQDEPASAKLKLLMKQEPSSDLNDDALLLLGRIEFRKKQYQSAYTYFEGVFTSPFSSPRENEARILGVQCLLALDRYDQADKLIRNSLSRPLQPREKSYLLEAQLPILLKKDTQLETFEALAYLAENHPNTNSRDKYKEMAKGYIDTKLTPDNLKTVSEEENIGDLRTEAMYQYAIDLMEENRIDQAKTYFSRIITLAPGSYLAQQSANMVKQLDARAFVEPKTFGAVLPLTGPYAALGQQTLRGLQQALGISGSVSKNNFRLLVLDSEGTPEQAVKAMESLVFKDHVMAIVGGLSAKTATAEAAKAQELGVPFISLSQKPGLTKVGPFIYGSSITPKLQVEHLVSYAMDRLNMKRFAVIYPNDRYGTEFANLFWDEVQRRGGKVTTAQTYNPGETDFKAHIKKMVGTYYLEDRRGEYEQLLREWYKKNKNKRKTPPETLLPPIINFDAIFIPDDPKALGQIAPMLAFNDVSKMLLLGTNLWNSPELVSRGQTFAEQAVFVDLFQSDAKNYVESPFHREFVSQYKERPGAFAVQGYDAGKLIVSAMQEAPRNRIDFLRMMSGLKKVDGATSTLSMGEDREVDRQLLALTVRKGQIVQAE